MQNVIQNAVKNRRKYLGLALVFGVFASAGVGCNASRESICGEFPAVAGEISGVQAQIAAVAPKSGRRIASVSTANAEALADQREAWLEWGEKALKRTQWAKDTLENDKRGRKAVPALNDAGLSLVSFHGFVEQGKWKKANAELDRVETSLGKARKLACDVEPAPAGRSPASASAAKSGKAKKAKKSKKAKN
ncbi:MAG: hypothetical protein JST04_02395 [Bdellovibrionales bacterium]|nr:hypothetical protein [Bdellovibrionales bacterium]